jgi:hypothetical protein
MKNPIPSLPSALTLTKNSESKMPLVLLLLGLCSALMWPPALGAAAMTPVFGPKQYTRTAGPPQTFTETFQHCGTTPCQLVMVNGNADGTNRISSASISLNGTQIIDPSDFNQQVAKIVKPVTLTDQNRLTVRLASKPGSFLTITIECAASPVVLSAGAPGVSLPNPTTLLSAFPIINTGTAAAENVRVTAITLTKRDPNQRDIDATLTSPALPFNLGTIPVNGSIVLDADFIGGPFTPRNSYALTVQGTYAVGSATYCFTLNTDLVIPPEAPGSAPLNTVTVGANTVSGAPFPHQPLNFGDKVNRPRWTVPTAPFVPGTPTATSTGTQMSPLGPTARLLTPLAPGPILTPLAPGPIVFSANNGLGLTSGTVNGTAATDGNAAEPSGASGGGVIFVTANWTAAYSTDSGATFTQLDPTTIFPSDAVGFCCDQIVQYVPSVDRFIWFLQGNGYRLASASPADIINSGGTAWTYWNLTPQVFGEAAGTSFDYPDLSVGNNELYMSWDGNGGFQVARTSPAGIQAGGTITIEFTHPSDAPMAWGSHLSQNTGDEIFWAGHNNNSQMRIFSLQEGSNTYFWRDRGISSWANNAPTSTTPDGQDWLAKNFNGPGGNSFPRNGVIGATRVFSQIWFAWTAGTDDFFQQAHVEMVTLDRNHDFNVTQQVQIWNNNYAFAYPALATNACSFEVGLSFEFGGGGNYENHVVGFWGDFVAYITTGSNVGTTRFGDYVTIRQAPFTGGNPGNLFTAFGYGLNSVPPPGTGTTTDIHYVLFGRPASFCIIP